MLTAYPPIVEVPIGIGTATIGEFSSTITNNGGENTGPLSFEISNGFDFGYEGCTPAEGLDPGESCEIWFEYTEFDELSAATIDPSTIRDVGHFTASGEDTPAPVTVRLIATAPQLLPV